MDCDKLIEFVKDNCPDMAEPLIEGEPGSLGSISVVSKPGLGFSATLYVTRSHQKAVAVGEMAKAVADMEESNE